MKHYGQRIEVKPQIATSSKKLQRIHTLRNLPDRVLHQKYHKILPHDKAVSISRLLEKWKNSNQMHQQQNPTLILKMSLLTSTAWLSQLVLLQLRTWTKYWDTMASIITCGKECFCHRKYKGMQNQAVHQWHRMMQSDNSRRYQSCVP